MMSTIHVLQNSTTREKLLKSVQSLRPFFCESLRTSTSSFDPYEYTDGGLYDADTRVQGEQQKEHMDCDAMAMGGCADEWQGPHGDDHHEEDGNNRPSWCTEQQFDHIGYEHDDVDSFSGAGYGLSVYGADQYYLHGPEPEEYLGYEQVGSNSIHRAACQYLLDPVAHSQSHMLSASNLQPTTPSCTQSVQTSSLSFISQDACRLHPLESPLQPHINAFLLDPLLSSSQNHQEFQHGVPLRKDIIQQLRATSMYNNNDPNFHEAQGDTCINALPIDIPPVCWPASTEAEVRETSCVIRAASLPQTHQQKPYLPQQPQLSGTGEKQSDFINGIATGIMVGNGAGCPNVARASGISSNLAYERRRRKKINEALYTLRSIVPVVSKMDKASIMADAVTYAKQLQKQVNDLQDDILHLQEKRGDVDHSIVHEDPLQERLSPGHHNNSMDLEKYFQSLPRHKILELNVSSMEDNIYHIQIRCEKGQGDFAQLARVMEALHFEIVNTSVATVGDQSSISAVLIKEQAAAATDQPVLKAEEVKERILAMFREYGLYV